MKQFYVTVEKVQTWKLTVEADDRADAEEKAIDEAVFCEPDQSYLEVPFCEEVKRVQNEF